MTVTRVESIEREAQTQRPEPDFDVIAALEAVASKRLRVALTLTGTPSPRSC